MKILSAILLVTLIAAPAISQETTLLSPEQQILFDEFERCSIELAKLQHIIPTDRIEECASIHRQVVELADPSSDE